MFHGNPVPPRDETVPRLSPIGTDWACFSPRLTEGAGFVPLPSLSGTESRLGLKPEWHWQRGQVALGCRQSMWKTEREFWRTEEEIGSHGEARGCDQALRRGNNPATRLKGGRKPSLFL